jgi:hypothetical protein
MCLMVPLSFHKMCDTLFCIAIFVKKDFLELFVKTNSNTAFFLLG